ncbi:MAG TPA: hypothetical protein PK920_10645 [Phycisphaerae bacterium]|nr:hypothetical protein [Phycisphaerae bacterium]HRT42736.1 hypothetical protein [Phycisphaerae bacterium]
MSSRPDLEPPPRGEQWDGEGAIRSTAFGTLLAGAVCLYFGFVWAADAPLSASPEAEQMWYLVDRVFRWWFRVVGVGFLAAAGLSALGKRTGALLSTAAEAGFSLLMFALVVNGVAESVAMGGFDAGVILFVILLLIGLSATRHSWRVFKATGAGGDVRAG